MWYIYIVVVGTFTPKREFQNLRFEILYGRKFGLKTQSTFMTKMVCLTKNI